jgi:hypothetical protein
MVEDELAPIDRAFAEGTSIDQALKEAVQEALKHHKRAGNPIVVWRNEEMHWIEPDDIQLPDEF